MSDPAVRPIAAADPVGRGGFVLRNLLWVDSCAGLLAGVLVLTFSGWLSELYVLPHELVIAMGVANVGYGAFSFSLARRARRPLPLIVLLAAANGTWAVLCFGAALAVADSASAFGLAHLVAEGVFVGVLAALEWSRRERLRHVT